MASFKFDITDDELAALHRKFNDGAYIKYPDFITAARLHQIETFQEQIDAPDRPIGSFNVHSPYCMNNPPSEDVQIVLNRIRRIVSAKRIRAEEFMREHDILRKGTIYISKFRSAVDNMRMDLT